MAVRSVMLGLLLVAAVAMVGACLAMENSTNLEDLAAVEIREYEGIDLASITDFRENSIKGPQHIDLDS